MPQLMQGFYRFSSGDFSGNPFRDPFKSIPRNFLKVSKFSRELQHGISEKALPLRFKEVAPEIPTEIPSDILSRVPPGIA